MSSAGSAAAEYAKEQADAVTIAVCSNRCENVERHWTDYTRCLKPNDTLLVILDQTDNARVRRLKADLLAAGVEVAVNGKNLGLARSRNIALERCKTNFLIFIDDDVLLSNATIESIRRELDNGTEIVGVRITNPEKTCNLPWYISKGQFHYLAIHNPHATTLTTWGACMGLSVPFVRANNLKFNKNLGRQGRGLLSGEDTTFLRQMKMKGAQEKFLREAHVVHRFDDERLTFGYMLRRAYWQGRSEFRRRNCITGLKKEWRRFFDSDAHTFQKSLLAFLYMVWVLAGICTEVLAHVGERVIGDGQ